MEELINSFGTIVQYKSVFREYLDYLLVSLIKAILRLHNIEILTSNWSRKSRFMRNLMPNIPIQRFILDSRIRLLMQVHYINN